MSRRSSFLSSSLATRRQPSGKRKSLGGRTLPGEAPRARRGCPCALLAVAKMSNISVTCHFGVKFGEIVIGLATCSLAESRAAPTRRTAVVSSAVGARPSSSRGAPHLAILRATSSGLASGNYPCGMVYTDNDGSRSARLARSRIERAAARSGSQAARKQMLQLSQTMREMRAPEPVSPSAASPPHKQARSNSPSSPLQSHPWGGSAASSTHSSRPKASRLPRLQGGVCWRWQVLLDARRLSVSPFVLQVLRLSGRLAWNKRDVRQRQRRQRQRQQQRQAAAAAAPRAEPTTMSTPTGSSARPTFACVYGRECGVCSTKLLKWLTRGGLAYCPHHESQQLPSCHSCDRLLPKPRPKTIGRRGRDDPSALLCSPCVPESPPPAAALSPCQMGAWACSKCASSAVDGHGDWRPISTGRSTPFFAEMGLQSACARAAAALALALVPLVARMHITAAVRPPPPPLIPSVLTTSPRLLPTAMLWPQCPRPPLRYRWSCWSRASWPSAWPSRAPSHATGSKETVQECFSHLASWHDGGRRGRAPTSQEESGGGGRPSATRLA